MSINKKPRFAGLINYYQLENASAMIRASTITQEKKNLTPLNF